MFDKNGRGEEQIFEIWFDKDVRTIFSKIVCFEKG